MKKLWIGLLLVFLLAACAPAAPALPAAPTGTTEPAVTRTPRPTVVVLNACDVIDARDLFLPMGEPMTIQEEVKPNQIASDFSFISQCVFAGSDPASETRLTLQVHQAKPGLDVAPIEQIAERYIGGMQAAGVTRYETVEEWGQAAFWLPETQTLTVFMEDGTGVTVSIQPDRDGARATAATVVSETLAALGY